MTTKRVAFGPSPMVAPSVNCFDQILEVTVTSLRLIGIPLNPSSIKSYIFRYWSISFGLILLLLNLVTNAAIFVKKLQNIQLKKIMTTRDWNVLINEVNLAVALVILHANLLVRTAPNWKEFKSMLHQIDQLKVFEDGDYEKFRRIIIKGVAVAIAMIAGGVATAIFVYFSPSDELMHPIQFIFICYTLFGSILFMTLGWTIVVMISILSKRTYLLVVDNDNFSRCYSLVVQLINNLNKSFGLCLLMVLVFYFIWLINGIFFAMVGLRERGLLDQTSLIIIFLEVAAFPVFFLFLYIPHRIIQEAHQLAGKLSLSHPSNEKSRQLAHHMELRVLLSPIHISAMGLVNVDLNLLPTIFGTCLTYVIVMIQFRASES